MYHDISAVKVTLPDCPGLRVPIFRITFDAESITQERVDVLYTKLFGRLSLSTTPDAATVPLFTYCKV
jgi:hypothetical protein